MTLLHVITIVLVLVGSILPELLLSAPYVFIAKCALLLAFLIVLLLIKKWRKLWRFALILLIIQLVFKGSELLRGAAWWDSLFQWAGFFSGIAANVASKLIGIVPVAAALLLLFKTPAVSYLAVGNLKQKADAIPWLGIKGDRTPWRRLAPISGVLIMLGTVALSIVTATGMQAEPDYLRLLSSFPLIVGLALVNSFCEGLVFRSAIMAPLKAHFSKTFVLLMTALFFGIAHFTGVPGGFLGFAMSAVLGYYIALSMYETQGFLSGWIIHFLQDVAIFSTLALLG